MTILEILGSSNKIIKENINVLAEDYKRITNRNVCKSCATDIQSMINFLKNEYKVVNFQLKKPFVIYKLQKGSTQTISNQIMSDELAIEFLKIKKERIDLFSKYPENWLELIGEVNQKKEIKKPCKTCKKKTANNRKRKNDDSK